jgi:hypothetical protein
MTNIIQLVEEMRAKLSQITSAEEELVWSLRDALSRVDEKLLHDVRTITTEHETRRGRSLHELQRLSARIGSFPTERAALSGLEETKIPAAPIAAADGAPISHVFRRGDWRQAANNIEDELDGFFEARAIASR